MTVQYIKIAWTVVPVLFIGKNGRVAFTEKVQGNRGIGVRDLISVQELARDFHK